ncbi:hypothetical protein P10VF_142 [Rhizobium phage vB_RleM_P10VF]|uniref:Uncharacterized protein n=1 Tax=Rhizobium phage vB_RleM_P10VF TaxID=1527770 RepID=A0A076YLW7_9CAUD|nr:hypothetical protein P10VF_142 [Rhizobium phage vB_RleM_P10VF]AIK68355.1 hypothetical protein P10VF_142 [Rhizobium phage vB_RleM_P10VF]
MSKRKEEMERWISETQMFQRIAKVPETPREELEKEWKEMKEKRK